MSTRSTRSRTSFIRVLAALAFGGALTAACADQSDLIGPPSLNRGSAPPGQDVAAAVRAQNKVTPGLIRQEKIVGTATGLDANGAPVIRVFTVERGVPGIPSQVDGIPVEIEVTGLIMADSDPTQKSRPAPVGFSVGHPQITAGTIGARVSDGSGNTYILSNNHVLANINNASNGDPIYQPGPFDGGTAADQIGTLSDFEPISFTSGTTNLIDAAIAAVNPADVGTSTPADGYGEPSSTPYDLDSNGDGAVDASILGLGVQKFGRTTQLTTGTLTEINVTVDVCYESLFGIICLRSARFVDQLGFTDISEGGDSGSLIVTDDGSNRPVALLYAGSPTRTLGNRIDQVLSRFNVTIDGDGSPPPPPVDNPPTASFTFDCNALTCDFDASASTDDNGITSYSWDFGDGNSGSGVTPQHTYASAGTRTVTLTVEDASAQQDTDQQSVTTTDPPAAATLTAERRKAQRGFHRIDLHWSNVSWTDVVIFRQINGQPLLAEVIDTVPGTPTGTYTDLPGNKGKGFTYVYFICEGTGLLDACTAPVTVTY